MPEANFPAYRTYTFTRQEANNAIMALLAGSRLAAHTLQLTEGSQRLLPEMFPAVDHIGRFNLKTELARQILLNADTHLGAVTVPYALAIHEDFVITCLDWLRSAGINLITQGRQVKAWNMHEILFDSCQKAQPALQMEQFHLLREMRNSQIHEGGNVSTRLQQIVLTMTGPAIAAWEGLTGRKPSEVIAQGRITFTTGDIFATFAVTKQLGRDVNDALQNGLPRAAWADVAVADYASQTTKLKNSDAWLRSLQGYARMNYSPVSLNGTELEASASAQGFWSRSTQK